MPKLPAKRLTFEEKQEIERLLGLNFSQGKIARHLNRSKTAIRYELLRFGYDRKYNALEAQKLSDTTHQEMIKKLREKGQFTENHPYKSIKQRIENLEMQVEILHETIKEMLKK